MKAQALRLSVTIGLAAVTIGLAVLIAAPIALSDPIDAKRAAPVQAIAITTGNLLINPDFENGYTYSLPCCNNIAVPTGWSIRWYTDTAIVIEAHHLHLQATGSQTDRQHQVALLRRLRA